MVRGTVIIHTTINILKIISTGNSTTPLREDDGQRTLKNSTYIQIKIVILKSQITLLRNRQLYYLTLQKLIIWLVLKDTLETNQYHIIRRTYSNLT